MAPVAAARLCRSVHPSRRARRPMLTASVAAATAITARVTAGGTDQPIPTGSWLNTNRALQIAVSNAVERGDRALPGRPGPAEGRSSSPAADGSLSRAGAQEARCVRALQWPSTHTVTSGPSSQGGHPSAPPGAAGGPSVGRRSGSAGHDPRDQERGEAAVDGAGGAVEREPDTAAAEDGVAEHSGSAADQEIGEQARDLKQQAQHEDLREGVLAAGAGRAEELG